MHLNGLYVTILFYYLLFILFTILFYFFNCECIFLVSIINLTHFSYLHTFCCRHSLPKLNTGSLYSMSSEESSIKSISSPPDFSGMTPPNHTVDGVKCLRNELNVRYSVAFFYLKYKIYNIIS